MEDEIAIDLNVLLSREEDYYHQNSIKYGGIEDWKGCVWLSAKITAQFDVLIYRRNIFRITFRIVETSITYWQPKSCNHVFIVFVHTLIEPVSNAIVDSVLHSSVSQLDVLVVICWWWFQVHVIPCHYYQTCGVAQPRRILQTLRLHFWHPMQTNWYMMTEIKKS